MRGLRKTRSGTPLIGRHTTVIWLAWYCALFVTWLLFVDTVDAEELAVGAGAVALSACLAVAIHQRGYVRFRPRAVWLAHVPRVAWTVLVDCGRLAGALVRRLVLRQPVEGSTLRVPFHYGGDTGRDGARRALVNVAISITPNSYVIDIDPEAQSLLIHRLVAAPPDRVAERERERAEAHLASPQPRPAAQHPDEGFDR